MQKLLKTKPNYKKIIADKEPSNKYDYKHSQTLSTNESKIHHESKQDSPSNFPPIDTHPILHKNLNRYGTSKDLFYLTAFQAMYSQSRTRQRIMLTDLCNFKDEELMEESYPTKKSDQELKELFQYYKYYINNPIIFGKDHFKTLYNFYEKKKYLQYKKLKAVLDLDDGRDSLSDNSMNDNISVDPKRSTKENSKTFYIMNLIQTEFSDKNNHSESKAFLQLNSNLEELLEKINSPTTATPLKSYCPDSSQKNSALFKKKKTPLSSHPISFKNTIAKKTKKLSFHNSNSSTKQLKLMKNPKDPYLSKFNMEAIHFPTMKVKGEAAQKKFRHASNLSMGQLDAKSTNFNISSPKQYQKKRLNSCETVISQNYSKEKEKAAANEKKMKSKGQIEIKIKDERSEFTDLEDFKNYLKRVSVNFRKSAQKPVERVTEKGAESGVSSHSSKFRVENSPPKMESMLVKKMKKKGPLGNYSAKSSLQKSPHHSSGKQHLIQESIINLKKKIRMAKETIKCTTSNSNLNLHAGKGKKV